MSNLKEEQNYGDGATTLGFIIDQSIKNINTSIPGILQEYDQKKRRAVVKLAIKAEETDGSFTSHPLLLNVPVIFPSSLKFTVLMPMVKGDPVMITFSQRGIEEFKKTYKESKPTVSMFDMHDAVVFAGFGPLSVTPASSTGATMQSIDGHNAIIIEEGRVTSKVGSNTSILTDTYLKSEVCGSTSFMDSSHYQMKVGGATFSLTSSAFTSSVPIVAPGFCGGGAGAGMGVGVEGYGPAKMISGIDMDGNSIANAGTIEAKEIQSGVNLTSHTHTDSQGGSTTPPK